MSVSSGNTDDPGDHPGMRLVQIWVPDVDAAGFVEEARRQAENIRTAPGEAEDVAWVEAMTAEAWADIDVEEKAAGRTHHLYVSTYCQHDRHGDCRLTCKICGGPCLCPCHQETGR